METKEVEKIQKRKRKKITSRDNASSYEVDRDIEHKSKRIHTSSSADSLADITMSEAQQENMLDTVSGHIHELALKERTLTEDEAKTSKPTKDESGFKSKKTRKRAKASEMDKTAEKSTGQETGGAVEGTKCDVGVTASKESSVTQESALEYLRLWKEEREKWTFKKKTQYWLLQNMYDRTKVPKERFKILLKYLSGLQGHQRELSVQRAKEMVDHYGEEGVSCSKRHYGRAVAVMRVLG